MVRYILRLGFLQVFGHLIHFPTQTHLQLMNVENVAMDLLIHLSLLTYERLFAVFWRWRWLSPFPNCIDGSKMHIRARM